MGWRHGGPFQSKPVICPMTHNSFLHVTFLYFPVSECSSLFMISSTFYISFHPLCYLNLVRHSHGIQIGLLHPNYHILTSRWNGITHQFSDTFHHVWRTPNAFHIILTAGAYHGIDSTDMIKKTVCVNHTKFVLILWPPTDRYVLSCTHMTRLYFRRHESHVCLNYALIFFLPTCAWISDTFHIYKRPGTYKCHYKNRYGATSMLVYESTSQDKCVLQQERNRELIYKRPLGHRTFLITIRKDLRTQSVIIRKDLRTHR